TAVAVEDGRLGLRRLAIELEVQSIEPVGRVLGGATPVRHGGEFSSRTAPAGTPPLLNGGAGGRAILRAWAAAPPPGSRPAAAPPTARAAGGVARLADVGPTAAEIAPVDAGDRLLGLGVRAHLYEAEAARAAGRAVGDHGRRLAGARLGEDPLQVLVGGV